MSSFPTIRCLLIAAAVVASSPVLAALPQDAPCGGEGTERPSFISTWQSTYSSSQSMNHVTNGTGKECQLCHRDASGGDPFNAYGWAIKTEMDGGLSFATALLVVGPSNSDADPTASSNQAEITSGTQPGWTDGANNTIFFSGGSQQTGQLPPAAILGFNDPMSFPTTSSNGTGVNPVVLFDNGGSPTVSPKIGSLTEPFGIALDCSGTLAPSAYGILVMASLKPVPLPTRFGELLCDNPTIARFQGVHVQSVVGVGPIPLPYDLTLVGRSYHVQGFCGDPVAGGFVTNALSQTIGI